MATYDFYDMHAHVAFAEHPQSFVEECAKRGIALFATTVTPQEYEELIPQMAQEKNVVCGVGLHPWWLEAHQDDVDRVVELIGQTRFVGEIGMDCSHRWSFFESEQKEALKKIASACAAQGDKVLSLHSVRCADKVLNVLEETGALENCTCIFHWFSGSHAELLRAINAGCYFSVGPRMIVSHKGRSYAAQIPEHQLLLETDLPPQDYEAYAGTQGMYTPDNHLLHLQETFSELCEARGLTDEQGRNELAHTIKTTSGRILGI